jgi:hypothetical protein
MAVSASPGSVVRSCSQQGFSGYNVMPIDYDSKDKMANPIYDAQQHFQQQAAAAPIMAADVTGSYFADDPNNATGASSLTSQAQALSNISGVGTIPQLAPADVSMEESDHPAPGARGEVGQVSDGVARRVPEHLGRCLGDSQPVPA